jgi:hypothetical protein
MNNFSALIYLTDCSYPLDELHGCPYALAGRDCVNKTHFWGETLHNYKRNEIKCVFEAGDKGKGHLMRACRSEAKWCRWISSNTGPAFPPMFIIFNEC